MGRFGHNKDGGVIVFGKRAREASGMCFGNGMMRQVDNLMGLQIVFLGRLIGMVFRQLVVRQFGRELLFLGVSE